jgi:hypothetical protein
MINTITTEPSSEDYDSGTPLVQEQTLGHKSRSRRRARHHQRRRELRKVLDKILFFVLHIAIIVFLILLWMHYSSKAEI